MEYMALGKPIVAFNLPEHRFMAQDAAVYAQPKDELDFAKQIALLMGDPCGARKWGKRQSKDRKRACLANSGKGSL